MPHDAAGAPRSSTAAKLSCDTGALTIATAISEGAHDGACQAQPWAHTASPARYRRSLRANNAHELVRAPFMRALGWREWIGRSMGASALSLLALLASASAAPIVDNSLAPTFLELGSNSSSDATADSWLQRTPAQRT